MLSRVPAAADNSVGSTDKNGGVRPHTKPPDWKAVEDLLALLARAMQQLHTYPATSPMCVGAIDACQRALVALDTRDRIAFRVTPSELLVDDIPTGRGSQVGQELAKRLHKASVRSVTIARDASARELGRFCEDLIRCGERGHTTPLVDMLAEHGIDRVEVQMASRPEVLEVGAVSDTAADDLRRERVRFDAQLAKGGIVNHLYPPQKGWVRVDPSAALPPVSLLDLAVLADDPATLAAMLLRLTDDAEDVPPAEALQKKYSDVAMVISALDPRVARRMFARLANAVLALEPEHRQSLLRRAVLPGLLDGRVDGAILRDFPDVELAESLCLLLDLETAAPELLSTALSRLELPEDRRAAMVPLLDERLRARQAAAADSGRQTSLTRHASDLVRVDGAAAKSFADFAAFDLSLDAPAVAVLDEIRAAVPAADVTAEQLLCLWHLLCLEPNPEAVSRFLERSFALLADLEAASRGAELPQWLASYRGLADRLREARPDVADVVSAHLSAFCTAERARWIVELSQYGAEGKAAAGAVVQALGPAVALPLAELLEREPARGEARTASTRDPGRAAAQLLVEHAALVAPALVPLLEGSTPGALRTLLRVLGSAGPGYEDAVAAYAASSDEQTAREALRGLARIGSAKAAAHVAAQIEHPRGALGAAAEETLWHFPAADARRHTRELLARRTFTMSHPESAERLLDRAARTDSADLTPVLADLAPLRFRFWSPAIARLARKAHGLLKTGGRA